MSLEDLRQKPIAVRRRIAVGFTISAMLVICAIGFTLPSLSQIKEEKETKESPLGAFTSLFSDIKEKFGNPLKSETGATTDPEASELIFQLMEQTKGAGVTEDAGADALPAATTSQNILENEGFLPAASSSNPGEFML